MMTRMNATRVRLRGWWQARDRRERVLLAAAATMIAAFVLWYGIYMPLQKLQDRAQARLQLARAQLDAVRVEIDALKAAPVAPAAPANDTELRKAVLDGARRAGFGITRERNNEQGDLEIEADSATPAQLFAWLDQLRLQHGRAPDSLSAARSGNQLRVQASFRRMARH